MPHHGNRCRAARRLLAGAAAGLGLLAPVAVGAEDPARDASPAPVGLDALLRLPADTAAPAPDTQVGGATRKEWQQRFGKARSDVQAAERQLAEAQAELEKLASGSESWQVAAPGGSTANSETGPLSFGLRQEIRRSREELKQAEAALSELRIEANLAGVPEEWIGSDDPEAAP